VNPTPLLTLDAVRDWVGDFEIGKGRPYAEGPAVIGCVRSGDALRASVKGTRLRPYRVRVSLEAARVAFAECSCPVGYYGKCKHVAAVLLAYLESPPRFIEVDDAEADLAARDKAELVALVKMMLRRAPELEPWLGRPLPGFSPHGPSERDLYSMAMDVIRAANPHDEMAPYEIAGGLREIIEYAKQFGPPTGDAVFAVVHRALADEGFGGPRFEELLRAFPAEVRERLAAARQEGEQPGGEELPF
jgi:hypothetical protein